MMTQQPIFKSALLSKIVMTITLFLVAAVCLIIPNVYALDKYVTDDVNIFLRRGPGAQYAFSGSVKAGDKVAVLETNQDGKYSRIQNEEGITAWIETAQLSDEPSLKEQVITLKAQVAEYQKQLESDESANSAATIESYNAKLQAAEKTIADLQNQIQAQNKQIDSMTTQVDEKRQALIQTWFIYGGGVAGAGLLIGLILPLLMPKRRSKDRWMN